MQRHASISEDGLYRYGLVRRWEPEGPNATFVMLNPSVADAIQDDPTIRRCIGFARSWGMGAIHVLNLYAYRATSPQDMWGAEQAGVDIVGPKTNDYLRRHMWVHLNTGWPLVAAWGAHGKTDRVAQVLDLLPVPSRFECLGTTKAGAPRHPLYVKGDTPLEPYRGVSHG